MTYGTIKINRIVVWLRKNMKLFFFLQGTATNKHEQFKMPKVTSKTYFTYESCYWFSDIDEINVHWACQWFRWLPERCSPSTVSRSFCLPPQCKHMWTLGRGKHVVAKLWFILITDLQMRRILLEKNRTWVGGSSDFQAVRWNRSGLLLPLLALVYVGSKYEAVISCLEKVPNFNAQFNSFEMKL